MTFADFVFTVVVFIFGYVLGTVFPLWQSEKEPEEPEEPEEEI